MLMELQLVFKLYEQQPIKLNKKITVISRDFFNQGFFVSITILQEFEYTLRTALYEPSCHLQERLPSGGLVGKPGW